MAQHLYVPGAPSFGHGAKYAALLGSVGALSGPKYGEIFYRRSTGLAGQNDITIATRIKAASFAGTPASAQIGAFVSVRGVCRKAYIGNAGAGANFSGAPVQILFGGLATVLDTGGKLVTSDLANFTWDGSSDVIVCMEFLNSDGNVAVSSTGVASDAYYKLSAPGDSGTITKSGYTLLANASYGVEAVRLAGFTVAAPSRALTVVCDGNSLVAGNGADGPAHTWPGILSSLLRYSSVVANVGVPSATTAERAAANSTGPLFVAGAKAVLWEVTNDLVVNKDAAGALTRYASWCAAVRAQGFKVIAATVLPRNDGDAYAGFEADRQTCNTSIRANYATYADALADVGADATIGIPGAYSNSTYFAADQVHLVGAGYEIAAGIINTAVLAA